VGAVFLFIPRRWIEKPANFADYFLPLRALKDRAVPKLAAPYSIASPPKETWTLLSDLLWPLSCIGADARLLKYEKEHY
jgi:hypothetical protein